MKKYLMILFLLAGLSNFMFAQPKQEGSETKISKTKKKAIRQMFHFEKQSKDKKMTHRGTTYRKAPEYDVEKYGFKSFYPMRSERRTFNVNASKKKRYHRQLGRTVYATR